MTIRNHQFPVQKERASRSTEPRPDLGANNKRLPCSEAESVSFTAPIAAHTPEAHETLNPTRDGEIGMTLRDYFAASVFPQAWESEHFARNGDVSEPTYSGAAERAYLIADAMIKQRAKESK